MQAPERGRQLWPRPSAVHAVGHAQRPITEQDVLADVAELPDELTRAAFAEQSVLAVDAVHVQLPGPNGLRVRRVVGHGCCVTALCCCGVR